MLEYKIKEGEHYESNDEIIIEEHGNIPTFTFGQLLQNIEEINKIIKELDSTIEHQEAKMKNISEFHPFVLDMIDEDLHTAHMYWEAKSLEKKLKEKRSSVKEQLDLELSAKEKIEKLFKTNE